ncbi:O-antigen ligase family protein [Clostridium thermarum]|uniref:O-antigen ligase family protein n=1 Tax=Clostridium thermarum TaxID=1716543 RepID=UPI0013D07DF5|nr:O-antigen ligase family protein [Clostridium thermarum]
MNKDIIKKYGVFLLMIALVIINAIREPGQIFAHGFAAVYLFIIAFRFSKDNRDFTYYSVILLSLMGSSLVIQLPRGYSAYFAYAAILIYLIIVAKEFILNLKNITRVHKNKFYLFLVIFLVYFFCSSVYAIFFNRTEYTLSMMVAYLYSFALFFCIVYENSKKERRNSTFKLLYTVFIGILLAGTLQMLGFRLGLADKYTALGIDFDIYKHFKHTPEVFFFNPNNYAVYLVLNMVYIIADRFYNFLGISKKWFLPVFILTQVQIIFTASRINWIMWVGLPVTYLVASMIERRKRETFAGFRILALSMCVFLLLAFTPFVSGYYGKIKSIKAVKLVYVWLYGNKTLEQELMYQNQLPKIGEGGSENQRYTLIYNVVKGVFYDKNYLGFGPGNTFDYIKQQGNTYGEVNVHSHWFEVLGDFGVLIFTYYLYFYAALLCLLYKAVRKDTWDEGYPYYKSLFITAFLLIGLVFSPSSVLGFGPFWIFFGLCVVTAAKYNNRKVSGN